MSGTYKATLSINKSGVELEEFPEQFAGSIVVASVKTLKGVDYIKKVEISIEKDDVIVKVNGEEIPLTPFPNDVIRNTLVGMASTLKGVSNIETLDITIEV